MPSASVKTDHHWSQESLDPIQKANVLFEKKIRNLEKRKTKLESYKENLAKGETLNHDQQEAIKAYDAVCASLEISREYSQQFGQIVTDNNKLLKKQMRKDQLEKNEKELERVREMMKVQVTLQKLQSTEVRTDFLEGNNGAVQLTNENLDQLEQVFKLITPDAETTESQKLEEQINSASEHFIALIDGKAKALLSSTYKEVRVLLRKVASCPYPENKTEAESNDQNTTQDENLISENTNGLDQSEEPTTITESAQEITKTSSLEASSSLEQAATNAMLSQMTNASSAINSSLPDNVLERITASEGPPPGLVPPSVSPVPRQEVSNTGPESLVAGMAQLNPCQPPPAPSVPTPGQSFFTRSMQPPTPQPQQQQQQPGQVTLDLHDLVPSGDFDFLQESQVQEAPQVYMDPAVVSLGTVKPESLVQLHEQQAQEFIQMQQQSQQNNSMAAAEASQMNNLSAQNNFNSQTYQGLVSPAFSQNYTNTSVSEVNANQPSQTQEKVDFTTESSNWADHEEPQSTTEEQSGWGNMNNQEIEEKWSVDSEFVSSWSEEPTEKNQNEFDWRNNYNRGRGNRNNGNRGNNSGNFRGNRGGNYGNYQNGSGSRGNYNGSFRGNRMNSQRGSGDGNGYFRGGQGGPRGRGSRGGFRGRGANGNFQQRSYQSSQ